MDTKEVKSGETLAVIKRGPRADDGMPPRVSLQQANRALIRPAVTPDEVRKATETLQRAAMGGVVAAATATTAAPAALTPAPVVAPLAPVVPAAQEGQGGVAAGDAPAAGLTPGAPPAWGSGG